MDEPVRFDSDTVKKLQARIKVLEDENRLLKERMDETGVSYADIVGNQAEEAKEKNKNLVLR